ncbi:prenyltransferase [bacterium]|nr:prenyltransferase [bacterium]MBU1073316.1 prenyltransferase [bacterium]MBU1675600.1 prenyltransferase [bacterium]
MSDSGARLILGPMRVPFLMLAIVCVLLGVATAHHAGAELKALHLALALLGGLAAHVAVNALNEYDDFRSGLDARTTRTSFSGGSGVLPANPDKARYGLAVGLSGLAVTVAVGVFFIAVRGWGILPLGLLGLLVVVVYTKWLTHSVLLCLLAPGAGFGLMTLGTHYVLAGDYAPVALWATLVPFFLVSNLLLINQLPDIEADAAVGRRHLMIVHGRRAGLTVYGLFLVATYASIAAGWRVDALPAWSLIALATVVIAVPTYRGAERHAEDIPALIPFLGRNVVLTLATPALLAIALFVS